MNPLLSANLPALTNTPPGAFLSDLRAEVLEQAPLPDHNNILTLVRRLFTRSVWAIKSVV
jgi:hypothetical protein